MNSLFQQLQQQGPSQSMNSNIQQAQKSPTLKNNLLSQFMSSSNPEQFIQNMIINNPKMGNAMQLFKASRMSPKQFFYQFAQQRGVDPDQFLNSMY